MKPTLTVEQVNEIRRRYQNYAHAKQHDTPKALSAEFGICVASVWDIINYVTYKAREYDNDARTKK